MELVKTTHKSIIKDVLNVIVFVVSVMAGTIFINTFIMQSFSVLGPSMESTLYTNDRLVINRIPATIASIQRKPYIPARGQVIVFRNPSLQSDTSDEFIVKRVIAFAGERVTVIDGTLTVYNPEHPDGFQPDTTTSGPSSPTSGQVDMVVPDDTLFVAGDHRQDGYSLDSRNGLGAIPLYDVVGPVSIRIFPFDKIRTF